MVSFRKILLDFDPFEVLDIPLLTEPLSLPDIARLKRNASRRLLQNCAWNEASQQLINRAAQALEIYFWADLVSWARRRGYGKPK